VQPLPVAISPVGLAGPAAAAHHGPVREIEDYPDLLWLIAHSPPPYRPLMRLVARCMLIIADAPRRPRRR
jgi:hypothetical protein